MLCFPKDTKEAFEVESRHSLAHEKHAGEESTFEDECEELTFTSSLILDLNCNSISNLN